MTGHEPVKCLYHMQFGRVDLWVICTLVRSDCSFTPVDDFVCTLLGHLNWSLYINDTII